MDTGNIIRLYQHPCGPLRRYLPLASATAIILTGIVLTAGAVI